MAADMNPPAGAAEFLAKHGWGGAEIVPIAGDASFRRYFRAVAPGRSAILMDAPPPHEDPRPYIAVAEWLVGRGFAAPAIHGADLDQGLVLIEDFGDVRMREAVDEAPAIRTELYEAAIDLLLELRRHEPGAFPAYGASILHREADLLPEWYCPAVGVEPDIIGYRAAWDAVFDVALTGTKVTVLRDFHAENLMLVGQGRALGLLDFQDALVGHPAYDLVSLLQDARCDVPPELEDVMRDRYRRVTGDGADFDAAYHVLGAQRNSKIIGIFTRLWKRDGKPRYPTLCPRVWRYLERDLAHPALAPVKAWFDASLPAELRGDPEAIGRRRTGA